MSAGAGDNGGAMMAGGIGQLADGDETELSKHTHARTHRCTHKGSQTATHTHTGTRTQTGRRAGGETRPSIHNGMANLFFGTPPIVWDSGRDVSTVKDSVNNLCQFVFFHPKKEKNLWIFILFFLKQTFKFKDTNL